MYSILLKNFLISMGSNSYITQEFLLLQVVRVLHL
jgi:hypothetical protein